MQQSQSSGPKVMSVREEESDTTYFSLISVSVLSLFPILWRASKSIVEPDMRLGYHPQGHQVTPQPLRLLTAASLP